MDRSTYIGSSDAADLLAGRWRKVFLEKWGRVEREDLSDNFKVQLGVFTEGFHLDWTLMRLRESGEGFTELSRQTTVCHPDHGFIASTPDALIQCGIGDKTPVEVKHSSGSRSMDEMLAYYMPQIQHHLLCTGAPMLLFSVIQGNSEPERRWVGASPEWAEHMLTVYRAFWHDFTGGIEPGRNTPADQLVTPAPPASKVPVDGMVARDATGDNLFTAMAQQFIETREAHAQHEAAKKTLKAEVKANEREVFIPGLITLKRNKAGSIGFTVPAPVAAAAE